MSSDERKTFEKWWRGGPAPIPDLASLKRHQDGNYIGDEAFMAWEAWQARAALPAPAPLAGDGGKDSDAERESIDELRALANRIERVAFSMRAPNEYTPQFVQLANAVSTMAVRLQRQAFERAAIERAIKEQK